VTINPKKLKQLLPPHKIKSEESPALLIKKTVAHTKTHSNLLKSKKAKIIHHHILHHILHQILHQILHRILYRILHRIHQNQSKVNIRAAAIIIMMNMKTIDIRMIVKSTRENYKKIQKRSFCHVLNYNNPPLLV